ncbi:MAG: hypothetical protein LBJ70_00490 [Holosporales bacterium]|jgi:O-methyltransferase|nr:hypothetical protein [Holosporales bacterium]
MSWRGFLYRNTLLPHKWLGKKFDVDVAIIPREDAVCTHTMAYDRVSPHASGLEEYYNYVRYRALELVRDELKEVPGSVAEFGVHLGDFAFMINRCFPDRKLFLYDMFDGSLGPRWTPGKRDNDFRNLYKKYVAPPP